MSASMGVCGSCWNWWLTYIHFSLFVGVSKKQNISFFLSVSCDMNSIDIIHNNNYLVNNLFLHYIDSIQSALDQLNGLSTGLVIQRYSVWTPPVAKHFAKSDSDVPQKLCVKEAGCLSCGVKRLELVNPGTLVY